jgi:hypothetical protein
MINRFHTIKNIKNGMCNHHLLIRGQLISMRNLQQRLESGNERLMEIPRLAVSLENIYKFDTTLAALPFSSEVEKAALTELEKQQKEAWQIEELIKGEFVLISNDIKTHQLFLVDNENKIWTTSIHPIELNLKFIVKWESHVIAVQSYDNHLFLLLEEQVLDIILKNDKTSVIKNISAPANGIKLALFNSQLLILTKEGQLFRSSSLGFSLWKTGITDISCSQGFLALNTTKGLLFVSQNGNEELCSVSLPDSIFAVTPEAIFFLDPLGILSKVLRTKENYKIILSSKALMHAISMIPCFNCILILKKDRVLVVADFWVFLDPLGSTLQELCKLCGIGTSSSVDYLSALDLREASVILNRANNIFMEFWEDVLISSKLTKKELQGGHGCFSTTIRRTFKTLSDAVRELIIQDSSREDWSFASFSTFSLERFFGRVRNGKSATMNPDIVAFAQAVSQLQAIERPGQKFPFYSPTTANYEHDEALTTEVISVIPRKRKNEIDIQDIRLLQREAKAQSKRLYLTPTATGKLFPNSSKPTIAQ